MFLSCVDEKFDGKAGETISYRLGVRQASHGTEGRGDGETRGRGDSDPLFRIQLLQNKSTVRNSQRTIFIETAQDPITVVRKGRLAPAQVE